MGSYRPVSKTEVQEKVLLVTVLPLIGIDYVLEGGEEQKDLGNGYVLVNSKPLQALDKFREEQFQRCFLKVSGPVYVMHRFFSKFLMSAC
jgi:hypothetical protein